MRIKSPVETHHKGRTGFVYHSQTLLDPIKTEVNWLLAKYRLFGAGKLFDQISMGVIPTVIDQNPCAHLRMPRDMIFHGWSMRLFQAWQHSATMSS